MPREKKEKKVKEPRRKKLKALDFASLPDAIVDGKFVVRQKGRVMFERVMWDTHKIEIHRGVVMSVAGSGISVYDDTSEQWYSFDMHTYPLIKAEHVEDLIEGATATYGVLATKIHLPVERTPGAGDTPVKHVGIIETNDETPSGTQQEEPGTPDEEVTALVGDGTLKLEEASETEGENVNEKSTESIQEQPGDIVGFDENRDAACPPSVEAIVEEVSNE